MYEKEWYTCRCPYCGSSNPIELETTAAGLKWIKCDECRKNFKVSVRKEKLRAQVNEEAAKWDLELRVVHRKNCGRKEIRTWNPGRPQPGICPQHGGKLPHRWVQNRIDRG